MHNSYLHNSTIVVCAMETILSVSLSSGTVSNPPKQMILILGDVCTTTEEWYIRPFRVSGSITYVYNTCVYVLTTCMYEITIILLWQEILAEIISLAVAAITYIIIILYYWRI